MYSEEKAREFQTFLGNFLNSSYLGYFGYCLAIPLPSLLVMLSVFNIPLQSPSGTVDENGAFFLLSFLAFTVAGFTSGYTFKSFFLELQLGSGTLLLIGLTLGGSHTLSEYALGHLIGFPVPFTGTYTIIPSFLLSVGMTYLLIRKRICEVDGFLKRLVDYINFRLMIASMIILFPILLILSLKSENPIIIALLSISFPTAKLVLRYVSYKIINRLNAHLDLALQMSICTVEFYSCLYLSMMMQYKVSPYFIGSLILYDILLNCFYVYHVYHFVKNLPRGIWTTSYLEWRKMRSKAFHMCEFVLLTEYIECVVPLMYLVWMWIGLLGSKFKSVFFLREMMFPYKKLYMSQWFA